MPQVTRRDHTEGRRRFFSAAASGILGGFALPRLMGNFLLARRRRKENPGGSITVMINPLAVPRRGKDGQPRGA